MRCPKCGKFCKRSSKDYGKPAKNAMGSLVQSQRTWFDCQCGLSGWADNLGAR